MIQPLTSATRNTHPALTCDTAFLIKIMLITSGPPGRDLHLYSTSGVHSEQPVHTVVLEIGLTDTLFVTIF